MKRHNSNIRLTFDGAKWTISNENAVALSYTSDDSNTPLTLDSTCEVYFSSFYPLKSTPSRRTKSKLTSQISNDAASSCALSVVEYEDEDECANGVAPCAGSNDFACINRIGGYSCVPKMLR